MPPFYTRKTPRAQWHDYRAEGMYFVTICTKDRKNYFGEVCSDIISGRQTHTMVLNEVGKICDEHICALASHWPHVDLHAHVVMPNHLHILLWMDACDGLGFDIHDDRRDPISAGPIISPDNEKNHLQRTIQDSLQRTPQDGVPTVKPKGPSYGSLGYIINILKGGITRECTNQGFSFARQSRYHDHIVRDEKSYETIKYYIQTNPQKRGEDTHYTEC